MSPQTKEEEEEVQLVTDKKLEALNKITNRTEET